MVEATPQLLLIPALSNLHPVIYFSLPSLLYYMSNVVVNLINNKDFWNTGRITVCFHIACEWTVA